MRRPLAALLLLLPLAAAGLPAPRADGPPDDPLTRDPVGPAHRPYRVRFPASTARLDMVPVPGGAFRMGSPESERGRSRDEGPRRAVRVRPFWMASTETTWDLFDLYYRGGVASQKLNDAARARDADAVTRPTPAYVDETHGHGREGHPALGISHHAALEFCHWLSRHTGHAYRLPTEAEWEWAARAGCADAYPWGSDPGRLREYGWYEANSAEATHPVARLRPNPFGLYDMHGNVAEWCLDQHHGASLADLPADRETMCPVRLPGGRRFGHVVRGGSFADPAARCRSAARLASVPAWNRSDPQRPASLWWLVDADFVGFRVVRAADDRPPVRGVRSRVTPASDE